MTKRATLVNDDAVTSPAPSWQESPQSARTSRLGVPTPRTMRALIGRADAALAVRERLGDLELGGALVCPRADRRAPEGAVGELELAYAGRARPAVLDGVLSANDEALAGVCGRATGDGRETKADDGERQQGERRADPAEMH